MTRLIEGTEYHKMIILLNQELIKVSDWLKVNKLTLNLTKTHFMVFHRAKLKHINDFELKVYGTAINSTLITIFLGIVIDS